MKTKSDCYALLQEVVTARDRLCRAPGCCGLSSAAHHIFGRGNLTTAFNPRYAIGMCLKCHVPWAHAKPVQFKEWVISWMGTDEFYSALRLSNMVIKHHDYDKIYKDLRQYQIYNNRS